MNDYTKTLARLMVEQERFPSVSNALWSASDRNLELLRRDDYAVPLSSYQPAFVKALAGDVGRRREDFPKHIESAEFLNPTLEPGKSAFHYPHFLYSVFQDAPDPDGFPERYRWMVELSARTTCVFDTGGFHIAKGRIWWTPKRLQGTLDICERHGKWAMTFDHPTFTKHPFQLCLNETVRNLKWLLRQRKGHCQFLNVYQALDIETALIWAEQVKFAKLLTAPFKNSCLKRWIASGPKSTWTNEILQLFFGCCP